MRYIFTVGMMVLLASCSGSTTFTEEKDILIDTQKTEIIEQSPNRIEWEGKDIPPMGCYYVEHPGDMTGSMLESIMQKHPEVQGQEAGMHFGQFVREYCSDGLGRYIFYSDDKAPISFGRYDTELDIFEGASYNTYYTKTIPQFARERGTGFSTRSGGTIGFAQKNIPYYPYTMYDYTFQKKENMEYCKKVFEHDRWGEDNCSYDAYYTYDFANTNTVTLDKICLFYNENGTRKPLESCRYNPYNESLRAMDQNNIKILYVGHNLVSTAEYYISIDCTRDDTSHLQIGLIPDDADVEVYIHPACNTKRIDPKIFDYISKKKFNTVMWFREIFPESSLYDFDTTEIQKLATSNWQYLQIEELEKEEYVLIRNTKNPKRKGFGYTKINYYNETERVKCDAYLNTIKDSHDESIWNQAREESEECYSDLPPIQ